MRKTLYIILSLAINLFLVKGAPLKCGEESIDNCKSCGKFDEIYDSCGTCQDAHFPLMENLLCIPCNNTLYGQVGCKGNCDGSDYSTTSFAFCDECIDGYYSLEGICETCEIGSPGCKKCTYLAVGTDLTNKTFKCQECISSEYKLEKFYCRKCSDLNLIPNCIQCHFEGEDQHPVCDKRYSYYYVNSEK